MSTILQEIVNWDIIRQNQEEVKSVFQTSGNCFVIPKLDAVNSEYYHIYLGYNSVNGAYQLSAFIIPSNEDIQPNLSGNLVSYPLQEYIGPLVTGLVGNGMSLEISRNMVSNWMNDQIRNTWIDDCFKYNSDDPKNAIFQAFKIRTSDFNVDDTESEHYCYFALKPNPRGIIPNNPRYVADIIVSKFLENKFFTAVYKDLAQPVPPYSASSFGLLNEIGIGTSSGIITENI